MHLHHLTLTTGHSRRSSSSEVWQETREQLLPLIREALDGGRPEIMDGYALTGTARGRQASTWTVHGAEGPLVTMLVCRRGKCVRDWEAIGGIGPQPQHPYCAVRLEPALAVHADAAHWLGDFERSVAWTWLEDLT